jgi:hypothetical protein
MQGDDFLDEHRLGSRDILDGLAGHRFGQEADEVTGVTGLHCHADFAVSLEAADSRAVAGAGIDHHERASLEIDFHSARRSDAHQAIVHRPLQVSAVDDQIDRIVEHMRCGLGQVLAVLDAALAHDIEEQDAALSRVHQIFHGGCKKTGQPVATCRQFFH